MIYHAINFVPNPPDSDFKKAQEISIESIKKFKEDNVRFICTKFKEDIEITNSDIIINLKESKCFDGKKLPFIKEIFDSLYNISKDTDWIGYTNSDIVIKSKEFYKQIVSRENECDAILFNRSEIKTPSIPNTLDDFLNSNSEVNPFSGKDGFFMKRKVWWKIRENLEGYVISKPYWDNALEDSIRKNFQCISLNNYILHYFHKKRWYNYSPGSSYNKSLYNKNSEDNRELVSVIIPVYNKEKFIEDTLYSVDRQLTEDAFQFEVTIVDDKSEDKSLSLVKSFKWDNINLKKVTILENAKNVGVSSTYTKAFKATRGNYIVLLDADDTLTRRSLYYRFKALRKNKSQNWVTGEQLLMKDSGKLIAGKEFNKRVEPKTKKSFINKHLTGELYIPNSSIMIKRECLEKNLWIKEMRSSQDFALILLLGLANEIPIYLKEYVTIYRYHYDKSNHSLYQRSMMDGRKINDFKILLKKVSKDLTKHEIELFNNWIKKWEKIYQDNL